jgi:hypothetical protein
MTTVSPINSYGNYLPLEFQLPDDIQEFKELVAKRERITSSIVNLKETGQYENRELQTSQQFFSINAPSQPVVTRYTFRKVIDIGALVVPGTKSVAHNLPVNSNYIFTRIYAVARKTSAPLWAPIPWADGTSTATITVDNTNVNIITSGAAFTGFDQCYAIIEYIKG